MISGACETQTTEKKSCVFFFFSSGEETDLKMNLYDVCANFLREKKKEVQIAAE